MNLYVIRIEFRFADPNYKFYWGRLGMPIGHYLRGPDQQVTWVAIASQDTLQEVLAVVTKCGGKDRNTCTATGFKTVELPQ